MSTSARIQQEDSAGTTRQDRREEVKLWQTRVFLLLDNLAVENLVRARRGEEDSRERRPRAKTGHKLRSRPSPGYPSPIRGVAESTGLL